MIPTTTVRFPYIQPVVGGSVIVAVVSSAGYLVGDVVLVAGGGYCTITAIDTPEFAPINPPNLTLKNTTATNPPGGVTLAVGTTIGPPVFVDEVNPPGAVVAGSAPSGGVGVTGATPRQPIDTGAIVVVTPDLGNVRESFPQDGIVVVPPSNAVVTSVSGRVVESFPDSLAPAVVPSSGATVTTVSGRVVEHFPKNDGA